LLSRDKTNGKKFYSANFNSVKNKVLRELAYSKFKNKVRLNTESEIFGKFRSLFGIDVVFYKSVFDI